MIWSQQARGQLDNMGWKDEVTRVLSKCVEQLRRSLRQEDFSTYLLALQFP